MSSSGIVIHCIGEVVSPPNPRKYAVLNGNFVFNLSNIFEEHNRGVK